MSRSRRTDWRLRPARPWLAGRGPSTIMVGQTAPGEFTRRGRRQLEREAKHVHRPHHESKHRASDRQPWTRLQPTIQSKPKESRERELQANARDSNPPVPPDSQSRPRVALLAHNRLPFPSCRHRIRGDTMRVDARRPINAPAAGQEAGETRSRFRRDPPLADFVIQAQSPLSTPQKATFEKFFTKSQGRPAPGCSGPLGLQDLPVAGRRRLTTDVAQRMPGISD
jgi:hypothetical protein